jgi:hypothetical protein
MVSSKYLENQGQSERFNQWIDTKPVAKFTGYPYELFKTLPSKSYQIKTLNAQFMQLVETAKKNALITTDLIVVRDTSYSMTNTAVGADVSCDLIAKSLALFFSHMLKGAFSDSWIEFSRDAKLHQWKGSNPYEKFINDRASVIGNTDFMSLQRSRSLVYLRVSSHREYCVSLMVNLILPDWMIPMFRQQGICCVRQDFPKSLPGHFRSFSGTYRCVAPIPNTKPTKPLITPSISVGMIRASSRF